VKVMVLATVMVHLRVKRENQDNKVIGSNSAVRNCLLHEKVNFMCNSGIAR